MAQITAGEFATEIGTTPKVARKFLRSVTDRDAQPGKGSRWMIEKRNVAQLRKAFVKWNADQEAMRAELAAKRASEAEALATAETDTEE